MYRSLYAGFLVLVLFAGCGGPGEEPDPLRLIWKEVTVQGIVAHPEMDGLTVLIDGHAVALTSDGLWSHTFVPEDLVDGVAVLPMAIRSDGEVIERRELRVAVVDHQPLGATSSAITPPRP